MNPTQRFLMLVGLLTAIGAGTAAAQLTGAAPGDNAVLVEAEAFDFEEGGKVAQAVGRPGTTGACLTTWNNAGHILGWTVEVPQTADYTLTLRVAAGRSGKVYREIRIDGVLPDLSFARLTVEPSGGFGKDLSHWRNLTLGSGGQAVSVRLTAGKHQVRMKNLGGEAEDGGLNLDQFFFAPDTAALRGQAVADAQAPAAPAPLDLSRGLLVDLAFTGTEAAPVDGVPCFTTLGAALKRIPNTNSQRVVVRVKPGKYKELIRLTAANVSLVGLGTKPEDVVLTYDLSAGTPVSAADPSKTFGTSGSVSFLVSADGFQARNVTFENSWDIDAHPAAAGTQAVAFRINGTHAVFENCRFLGHQDTLYADQGQHYFLRCFVAGDVDFVFGSGQSVFDQCEFSSLSRKKADSGGWTGYVSAASTKVQQPFGYLFYRCRLTADPGVRPGSVALGRPWRPSSDASALPHVVFRECELGAHIAAAGWTDMGASLASTAVLLEYGNVGPGASVSPQRRQVADQDLARYTPESVLAGWDFPRDLQAFRAAR